ncbi:hypothetical protein CCACVL1_19475, partial [Corchorus capsularis]
LRPGSQCDEPKFPATASTSREAICTENSN